MGWAQGARDRNKTRRQDESLPYNLQMARLVHFWPVGPAANLGWGRGGVCKPAPPAKVRGQTTISGAPAMCPVQC